MLTLSSFLCIALIGVFSGGCADADVDEFIPQRVPLLSNESLKLDSIYNVNAPVLEVYEKTVKPAKPALFYDKIFIKFDPDCRQQAHVNLVEHFTHELSNGQPSSSNNVEEGTARGFLSVDPPPPAPKRNGKGPLPDPYKFANLIESQLLETHKLLQLDDSNVELLPMEEPKRKARSLADTSGAKNLGSVPKAQRENEIMSTLYLLMASRVLGEDNVPKWLELTKGGQPDAATEFLKQHATIALSDETIRKMAKLTKPSPLDRAASQDRSFQSDLNSLNASENGSYRRSKNNSPVLMASEVLHGLQMRIIHNPVLDSEFLDLADMLPCKAFKAEPDQAKLSLGDIGHPAPSPADIQTPHYQFENNEIDVDTADTKNSLWRSVLESSKSLLSSSAHRKKYSYALVAPNDAHFNSQWYLKGATQSEPFGGYVIDGWSYILKHWYAANHTATRFSRANDGSEKVKLDFSDLKDAHGGMTVAVLDSGCSRNPDLKHQFWRNEQTPGCRSDSFVGSDFDADKYGVAGDCVGYDFGNDQPDPTLETEGKIHGSSTAGLIAAETNNKIGIAGICPQCKIMCLKIYDSEKKKITMNSVVRALDYIARKKIKLSNHSYGGFGASSIEFAAHETLGKLGHLAVCSSGNNGCDIDAAPSSPQACLTEDGEPLGPFTPASYDLNSIISVGGTTQDGEVASFSNYGERSVDVFAPGDAIVTIYGSEHLASVRGTSFSSPIVAGMAATLWSFKPELTAEAVKHSLLTSGAKVEALKHKAKEPRIVSLSHALSGTPHIMQFSTAADAESDGNLKPFFSRIPVCCLFLLLSFS